LQELYEIWFLFYCFCKFHNVLFKQLLNINIPRRCVHQFAPHCRQLCSRGFSIAD